MIRTDSARQHFFENDFPGTRAPGASLGLIQHFDMSLAKEFPIRERYQLRFELDAFNIFNHPDFDAPNNNVTFLPNFSGPPSVSAPGNWA
jgi:hypothetical protein